MGMRQLRFLQPKSLMEVTTRAIQGRYLLRPGPGLRDLLVGILAKARERYDVRVHAVCAMSSHMHLLLTPADAEQLAGFMGYVKTNISKEVGRLHDWPGPMWEGRYHSVAVTDEEAAQVARLEYLLSQGVKEGLVASPHDWPGLHSATALVRGEPLEGWWFDRTAEYWARQRGETFGKYEHAEQKQLELEPLPCWAHLPPEVYRRRVAEIVERIEGEARDKHEREGTSPAGADAVQRVHPHYRPGKVARSPMPLVHAASKRAREEYVAAYREFAVAYREASQQLRSGDRMAIFPEGCFPPALPFEPG